MQANSNQSQLNEIEIPISAIWWLYLPILFGLLLLAIAQFAPGFYQNWLESEQSLLEILHIFVPVTSCILAIRIIFHPMLNSFPWIKVWLGMIALGSVYIAGEETSWGQHFLNWDTPSYWSTLNDQNETNLHNVSSWFDQKPRLLLEAGIIVGGILIPIYRKFLPIYKSIPLSIILPANLCFPTAIVSEIVRVSEKLVELFEVSYFIFYRASEVQETYFYWFILLYLLALKRKIENLLR